MLIWYINLDAQLLNYYMMCSFQFGGAHRYHRQALSSQVFNKLPGRLAFSLRSLVDENVLHDG